MALLERVNIELIDPNRAAVCDDADAALRELREGVGGIDLRRRLGDIGRPHGEGGAVSANGDANPELFAASDLRRRRLQLRDTS